MKKGAIILFCFLSAQTFAQWKSYYHEEKKKEKVANNQGIDKENFLYENHLFNGLKSKSLENYEDALKQFQKCIKLNKKQALPFYESALINKNQGNFDLAQEQIETATALEKNNRWYQLAYAEILFSKQNFKSAAEEYKKLILLEPNNEELYYLLADTYIYDKDFLKSQNFVIRVKQLDQGDF